MIVVKKTRIIINVQKLSHICRISQGKTQCVVNSVETHELEHMNTIAWISVEMTGFGSSAVLFLSSAEHRRCFEES